MKTSTSRLSIVWSIALLVLFMPFSAIAVETNELLGHWYGEGEYDNEIKTKWLTIREANGYLSVKVRYYKDGMFVSEAMSTGTWKLDGERYIATYSATNARVESPPQVHQYELLGFDGDVLTYQSLRRDQFLGTIYQVRRVQSDFALP